MSSSSGKRSSASDSSASKRQRESLYGSSSAEEPPSDNEESPPEEEEEEEEKAQTFKLECQICCDTYRYPAVTCTACNNYTCCEQCLASYGKQKNGLSAALPCPYCRSTQGFAENRVINQLIGQAQKACNNSAAGCTVTPAIADMQLHLSKYCEFEKVHCVKRSFGCPWSGLRSEARQHEGACDYEHIAKLKEQDMRRLGEYREQLTQISAELDEALNATVTELRRQTCFLKEELANFRKGVDAMCKHQKGQFIKMRAASVNTLQLSTDGTVNAALGAISLQLSIELVPGNYYQVWASFDSPKLKLPIELVGWVVSQDEKALSEFAVQPFHYRFGARKERALIFDERAALGLSADDEEELVPKGATDFPSFRVIARII